MKRIVVYLQPIRTFLPCSGVGRHINGMVNELVSRSDLDVSLLFARQWLGSDGRLPENCPLRGLPFQTFSLPERLVERCWKLAGVPGIERFLHNADVLYCPSDTVFPQTSIPSFVTIHDIHPLDPLYPAYELKPGWNSQQSRWRRWVPRAFKTSSSVLTVSEFCRDRMGTLLPGIVKKPISVVGNGVDASFFALAERDPAVCERPVDGPYVLVIGGLTDRKGAKATLKVCRELQRINSVLKIVVVGKSEPKWSQAACGASNVVEVGPLSDELMGEYLRAASSLLFLSQYEGFGIPIIEAMAAGTPVVCSDTSSLPEIAGDVGYVFPSDAIETIAERLVRLTATGCADRRSRVQSGMERAGEFTWRACVDRLVEVFKEYA